MFWQYRPADYCSREHGGRRICAREPLATTQCKMPFTCYNTDGGGYVFLLFQVF
jgi:hypothetical protein